MAIKEDGLYKALRHLLAYMGKDRKPTEMRRIVKTAMKPKKRARSAKVMRSPKQAKMLKTRPVKGGLYENKPMKPKDKRMEDLLFVSSKTPIPPVFRYPTNF